MLHFLSLLMLSIFIIRCNAGMMNKFADNIEKESLELECLAENTFQTIDWPTCKNSKY